MFSTEQRVARFFLDTLKIKVSKQQYFSQVTLAKSLLSIHSEEDIILVIKYISVFPLKQRIYSLGYLPYIFDEVLPKARYWEHNSKIDTKKYDLSIVKKVSNTKKEKKSMFKNTKF